MKSLIFYTISLLVALVLICSLKNVKIKRASKVIITLLVTFGIIFLSCIPVEKNIITFTSPEKAVEYLDMSEKIEKQIDVDGGAFLICSGGLSDNSYTIKTVLKRGDRWSFPNINSNTSHVQFKGDSSKDLGIILSSEKSVICSGLLTYNSELDMSLISCGFIVTDKNMDDDTLIVTDSQGSKIVFIEENEMKIKGISTKKYRGYILVNGNVDFPYILYIDGVKTELYKS